MCRTMKELERVVADYRSMKAMKEQIDAEVKSLEYEIIGYMDANEKLTETGNDFTIKLSTCERRTVDTKRLEADFLCMLPYKYEHHCTLKEFPVPEHQENYHL